MTTERYEAAIKYRTRKKWAGFIAWALMLLAVHGVAQLFGLALDDTASCIVSAALILPAYLIGGKYATYMRRKGR